MGTPVDSRLLLDFRSLALMQVEEAAARCRTKVEVPGSAVGHIVGKSHRTIKALGQMPGITHVSVHEDLEDEEKQVIQVEGSEDAVAKVLAQIKRLHMRSYAASVQPGMQYSCFSVGATRISQSDDPLILRVATADKLLLYMPQHLRTFLYRNFPEDFDDRVYYYFHSRSSGEAAALSFIVQPTINSSSEEPSTERAKRQRNRKKFLEKTRACQVFGSWEKAAYHHHLAGTLSKLLLGLLHELPERGGATIKMRLLIGKALYFGTDLSKSGLWKLSVEQMDDKVLHQTLRPFFSVYSSSDSVRKVRQFLHVRGYQRVSATRMISAQMVDMDTDPDVKESYHLKLNERYKEVQDEPLVRFHKVGKKHAFLTFLNDHKGVDLELRIQSRQSEGPLDKETSRSIFEAWHKLAEVEDPLISPSGKRYHPLNVLHKGAETYRKDAFEVVITEVQAGDKFGFLDQKNLLSRWKVSIRSLQLQDLFLLGSVTELEIENLVQDILHHVDLLLCEASKVAGSMATHD